MLKVISLFPHGFLQLCGRMIGNIVFRFSVGVNRVARTNLERCFDGLQEERLRELHKESLIESATTMLEIGYVWNRPVDKILRSVIKVEGGDELKAAFENNNGVILAAPHFGSWEILGLWCAERYPCSYLYRPPKLKALEQMMIAARSRNGANIVPTNTTGIKKLFKALKHGEIVGILPDQEPASGEGIFAPFFNIQANTMVLLSKLAAKTQAVVFVSYAERVPGKGYILHFKKLSKDINSCDIATSVRELNNGIEKEIRKHPAQYQWIYKRFKSRPAGEESIYD